MAQANSQTVDCHIIKTKGKVTLPPMSLSIIEVKTPKIPNTTILYELNADTFQLPKCVILLNISHRVDHKTPQHLNIPILNAKNVPCSIGKKQAMCPMEKCDEAQEVR